MIILIFINRDRKIMGIDVFFFCPLFQNYLNLKAANPSGYYRYYVRYVCASAIWQHRIFLFLLARAAGNHRSVSESSSCSTGSNNNNNNNDNLVHNNNNLGDSSTPTEPPSAADLALLAKLQEANRCVSFPRHNSSSHPSLYGKYIPVCVAPPTLISSIMTQNNS